MTKKVIIISITLFVFGAAVGWCAHMPAKASPVTFLRENPADYKFIDPVLLLQVPEDTTTPQFQSLKKDISSYITTATAQHKVTNVSVYFRQLNQDRWVGINAEENYAPASMFKVISLIAFLRQAQWNPTLLSANVTVATGGINADAHQDYYPPADPIRVGDTYSSQELLSHMIVDSDNNASFLVDQLTSKNTLDKTYSDLGIPNPNNTSSIDFVSPHTYSRIFRSLYNGAYLSDSISEQALELMSKTTFTQGLVAGVPAGTVVSHKFGERTVVPATGSTDLTIHELHDCGIVYAPGDPYLLCIMTKGTNFPSLEKIINDISAITWTSIQGLSSNK
jgi:beta-lactamase class A